MDKFIPIFFDLFIVILLFYCTYRGYRSGFVKMIVSFLGYLLSLAAAYFGSRVLASLIATNTRSGFIEFVAKKLGDTASGLDLQQSLDQFQATIPGYLQNAIQHYFGSTEQISGMVNDTTMTLAESVTDTVILPVVTMLIQAVLFFVIFGICCFVVRHLVRMCGFLRRVPLIGSVNAVLGGLLGCFQSLLFLVIITSAVSILLVITGGIGFMNEETISQTYLFQLLYRMNPFVLK